MIGNRQDYGPLQNPYMNDHSDHCRPVYSIAEFLAGPNPPGKASNYIRHAKSEIRPGDKVILFCRVSDRSQEANLDDQEANLRWVVEKRGAKVLDPPIRKVKKGWDISWLNEPAARAREHGAKLLAETPNRFIRPRVYDSRYNQDAQASEEDLELLRTLTEGVILVTDLHADATAGEERAYEIERGHRAKGNKGGRPKKSPKRPPGFKRERRRQTLERVLALREKGWSIRDIAKAVDVRKSTVGDWIRKWREEPEAGRGLLVGV